MIQTESGETSLSTRRHEDKNRLLWAVCHYRSVRRLVHHRLISKLKNKHERKQVEQGDRSEQKAEIKRNAVKKLKERSADHARAVVAFSETRDVNAKRHRANHRLKIKQAHVCDK
jgi:hypothetical protein